MAWRSGVAAGALIVVAIGCAHPIRTTSEYDDRADFDRSYSFFLLQGQSSGDSRIDEQLAADIRAALMSKGWVDVGTGAGRSVVVVNTATDASHTYESFYRDWGGWLWRSSVSASPHHVAEDFTAGTVVVTIFDAESKRPIWRGAAVDAISHSRQHAVDQRRAAVTKLFAGFPPVK